MYCLASAFLSIAGIDCGDRIARPLSILNDYVNQNGGYNLDRAFTDSDRPTENPIQLILYPQMEVYRPLPELDYLTRKFVRDECGIFGATLDDRECDLVILETQRLYLQGQFHHTGIYWIANALAADNLIHPQP